MKWMVLKTLFGALLALISITDSSEELTFTCETRECCRDWCFIFYASFASENDTSQAIFPNSSQIVFKRPFLGNFSSSLMSGMEAVKDLQVDEGLVPSIYVKPTLSSLWAQRNKLREVLIDDEDNHQLRFLEVTFNKLQSIPANINRLKQLVYLFLNDNEIEAVNLDVLNGLNNLELVTLYRNRIVKVDTTSMLKLPALIDINLSENQLEDLNISLWEFPNLKMLFLASNKLRSVENLAEKFPTLNETSLNKNRWNCDWLRTTVKDLQVNQVEIKPREKCSKSSEGGICCE